MPRRTLNRLLITTEAQLFRLRVLNGLRLWLDASDIATITESGGLVSQWDDKSGTGSNATQGTGANQMTTDTNTMNGKNVLSGVDSDYMAIPCAPTGIGSVFIVMKTPPSFAPALFSPFGVNDGSNRRFYFRTEQTSGILRFGIGTISILTDSGLSTSTDYIITGIAKGSEADLYVNGNAEKIAQAYTFTGTSSDDFIVGARTSSGTPTEFFNGADVAEALFYNRALSASEISSVHAYLSNKWGITLS